MAGLARFYGKVARLWRSLENRATYVARFRERRGHGADPTRCDLHLTAVKAVPLNQPKMPWNFPC